MTGRERGGFQKGGFGGCSPGTKTGMRLHSPNPPFYETALLSPLDKDSLLPPRIRWQIVRRWGRGSNRDLESSHFNLASNFDLFSVRKKHSKSCC